MSEKIYAWLLRLYPSRFRDAYGDEALQLFRDRSRDERGFPSRLRLWFDLLSDLALSVPRVYFHVQPQLASFSAHLRPEGVPSFFVLANEPLGPGALLFGGVLSVAALLTFTVLLNHGVKHVPLSALIRPAQPTADASSSQQQPEASANPSQRSSAAPDEFRQNAPSSSDSARSFNERTPPAPSAARPIHGGVGLDAAERRRVINGAIANLRQHYAYPDVARKMANALREHERSGDYDAVSDGEAFAALLTRQMREVSPDRHLSLDYSEVALPRQAAGLSPEDFARYREVMERRNCTFEKVEILPRNIGYLKLNSFPDPSVCEKTAEDAMASLNHTDALIFDLRDNRGGEPAMVAFLAAYLFDHPEYLYNPRENTTEESWTRSPVPGNQLADKPVYVLTSRRTFSGAEQFCYDLKMLKRATLVGETTGGGAHSGVWHRIDDHFGIAIPETKAINPFSKTDWAEVGVDPDLKVEAAGALNTALSLAERKPQKK